MAGEIQVDSVTALTVSGSDVVLNNVNTATNRTNLGLGSMATQNSSNVSITGGSITVWGDEIYLIDANHYANTSRNFVISHDGEYSFNCPCVNPSSTSEILRMSGYFTVSSSTISGLTYSSNSGNLTASSSGSTLTLASTSTTRAIAAVIIYKEV